MNNIATVKAIDSSPTFLITDGFWYALNNMNNKQYYVCISDLVVENLLKIAKIWKNNGCTRIKILRSDTSALNMTLRVRLSILNSLNFLFLFDNHFCSTCIYNVCTYQFLQQMDIEVKKSHRFDRELVNTS